MRPNRSKHQRSPQTKRMKRAKGGKVLKPVDKSKNPGLAKLPTKVRNKMGFMKDGGKVSKDKMKRPKGRLK